MKEEWRPVVGFEGYSLVSDRGQVKRTVAYRPSLHGRMLKAPPVCNGYPAVSLSVAGQKMQLKPVHILVARAFLGPAPGGMEVNHKDGNKLNAGLSNLEYVTHRENVDHAVRIGLVPRGTKCHTAVLVPSQVKRIRKACAAGRQQKLLAREYGVSTSVVCSIVNGGSWKWLP